MYAVKIGIGNSWITHDYLDLIKKRDRAYVRWKKSNNQFTRDEFTQMKNRTNNLRKLLRRQHVKKNFMKPGVTARRPGKYLMELLSIPSSSCVVQFSARLIYMLTTHSPIYSFYATHLMKL
ncbi:hypothetical protein HHI36_012570 [Cryptolaemus montrouzieri]|uniref:Uncharacterized protein n=1 Tax=Cryptolaemus montrouzieri TaxID=559131 RepID=A0ABD2NFQ8_9CUCU